MGEVYSQSLNSVVYWGLDLETGKILAIKMINIRNTFLPVKIFEKIAILKDLEHKNIIKLHEIKQEPNRLYLISDMVAEGSLQRLLDFDFKFSTAILQLLIG